MFQFNADTDWYDQMNSILSHVDERITVMKVRLLKLLSYSYFLNSIV